MLRAGLRQSGRVFFLCLPGIYPSSRLAGAREHAGLLSVVPGGTGAQIPLSSFDLVEPLKALRNLIGWPAAQNSSQHSAISQRRTGKSACATRSFRGRSSSEHRRGRRLQHDHSRAPLYRRSNRQTRHPASSPGVSSFSCRADAKREVRRASRAAGRHEEAPSNQQSSGVVTEPLVGLRWRRSGATSLR